MSFRDFEIIPSASKQSRANAVTNESNFEETLNKVGYSSLTQLNTVHLGASCLYNLDLACRSGVDHIVIFDISSRVEQFWQAVEKIIVNSANRLEVYEKLNSLFYEDFGKYFCDEKGPNPSLEKRLAKIYADTLAKDVIEGNSWLCSDERFNKIKNIFSRHHFRFVLLDLSKPREFLQLLQLKDLDLKIKTIYLSNILEIYKDDKEGCLASLEPFIDYDTFVIDAKKTAKDQPFSLAQRCRQKKGRPLVEFLFD